MTIRVPSVVRARATKSLIKLTLIPLFGLLSSCASNHELYAKYDKSCDVPPATVKIVENIKYKDKVKVVYKDKVVGVGGLPWEPAVYFGFDLATLDVNERQRLAADVVILKKFPSLKVNIQAFTDSKGSHAYNRKLSERRQDTVVNYLTTRGIDRQRILVSALGEELPILGLSEQGRTINRRVEMMLLDSNGRPLALKIQPQKSGFAAPSPVR